MKILLIAFIDAKAFESEARLMNLSDEVAGVLCAFAVVPVDSETRRVEISLLAVSQSEFFHVSQ